MHISRLLNEIMLTYSAELTEISRDFWKKARESALLYLWFSVILVFSIIMSAYLTIYITEASFPVDAEQVFFLVFFLFMLKSTADFHRYFVASRRLEHLLASPQSYFSISAGIFMTIFWINLGLWTLFSSSYVVSLLIFHVPAAYPWLYLNFILAVILSAVVGTEIAIHYFSAQKYRIIIPVFFITALWYFHELPHLAVILSISSIYLVRALKESFYSFGFVNRRKRRGRAEEVEIETSHSNAITWKEIILLWRERLIISFMATSVSIGLGGGYMATHMDVSLIPMRLRPLLVPALPFVFLVLGTFILASYIFVFPALNTFLAEEKTLWVLKHLPISGRDIVRGKMMAISLPLLTSLPFPFFFIFFLGANHLYLGFSLLFLSFFISTSLSLPFGIRYAGKKSDVMLLYSISVIFFSIFFIGAYIVKRLTELGFSGFLAILAILSGAALFFFLSMKYSGDMMEKKWAG